jgi:hypothetical protein
LIRLIEPPRLVWPTEEVGVSYLVGEQASDCLLRGTPTQRLERTSEDFAGFVTARRGVQVRWAVPSTIFCYVLGEYYLGRSSSAISSPLNWPGLAATSGTTW